MNFNTTSNAYKDDRYSFILKAEESGNSNLMPYKGSKWWVNIGIGFLTVIAFFISTSNCNAVQPSQVCPEIHKFLILRQQNRAPADFVVESREQGGGDDVYPNLDIDSDGVADSIIMSCGAGTNALCSLFVKLSNGKEFELEEDKFFLIRINGQVYALVGESLSESEASKLGKRKAYQITSQVIKLICTAI